MIQNRNPNNLPCAIVFDFVNCVWLYSFLKIKNLGPGKPLPSDTIKNKKRPHFFLTSKADVLALKPSLQCHWTFVKVGFHDKVTGLWAFEVQVPHQNYQQPPIVVKLVG